MNLRPVPVLALVVVMVLGVLTLGVTGAPFVASEESRTVAPGEVAVPVAVPIAGGTVCVTGAREQGQDVDLMLLTGPGSEADDGARDARSVVLTFGEDATRRAVGPVAAGDLTLVEAAPGEVGWVWSGWAGLPVATWHESRVVGSASEPGGVIASTCLPTDATEQAVLGLRTDESHEALVRLVNPFLLDATFAVAFVTPFEETRPVVLRNVSVPAGEVVTVRLNDHVPEERDIAAIVTVGSGRLAIEGLQSSVAALGGVDGLSAVPALPGPSLTWAFPWVPVGPEVEGAVWVLNTSARAADVEIAVHTAQGATTTPLDEVVRVAPRSLVRLDAADLAPDGGGSFGVTLRSDTPVVAAAGAAFLPLDGELSGLVRFAAATGPDGEWSVAGRGAEGRREVLHVLNLSDVEVRPLVTLTTLGTPVVQELDAGVVAPGAVTELVLPVGGARAWAAVVSGPGLVVSRSATGDGRLDPLAVAAVASSAWRTTDRALLGRPLDGWVARVGTAQEREREVRLPLR